MSVLEDVVTRTNWKERLIRLRDRVLACEDETPPWARGIIATEVWLDNPEDSILTKTTEVIARCLEEIPPTLLPEDRFAGFVFRRLRVHQGVSDPDGWRTPAKHVECAGYDESWPLPDDVREIYKRWQNSDCLKQHRNAVGEKHKWLKKYGICAPNGMVNGHTLPDYSLLLTDGLNGFHKRLIHSLCAAKSPQARTLFLAMDRIVGALRTHCHKCAELAYEHAAEADNEDRKLELLKTAADCEHIAGNPPATLAQALQLIIIGNCADILNNGGDAHSFGRLDQILFPFYKADTEAGRIDREEALYLVGAFLAKIWAIHTSKNLCIGGVRPDGREGTNDLSYMFLEATEAMQLACDISIRMHKNAPSEFLTQAAKVIRLGLGRGSMYNDDVTIESLLKKGVALEDARDYAPLGCVELNIPGRTSFRTMSLNMNLNKVLELVLNRGICMVTGDQIWSDIPNNFNSFDDLMTVYHKKVREAINAGVEVILEDERIEVFTAPRPWMTALSHGGLEDGRDMCAGQTRYDPVGVNLMGIADIANSLYALNRLVYEEKAICLDSMRSILQSNWEEHETLRQRVINRFPRFGQDTDEINSIAEDEAHFYAQCFEDHRTYYGDRFWPLIFGVSANMVYGANPKTGATPGGRKHPETLAHSLQPSPEGPRGNLTEILSACTAIDHIDFAGGISNVQECDPSIVAGDDGLKRLETFLKGYMAMGGMELSLNFLSVDKLYDAQKNPEKYPYLMVRLFGLSARFVALSPQIQQTVIERALAAQRKTH